MAARGPEEKRRVEEKLNLCRAIMNQIIGNEALLQVEGVLRVAGQKNVTDEILSSGVVPEVNAGNIHHAIDALKQSIEFLGGELAEVDPGGLATLQEGSFRMNLSADTIEAAQAALTDYIGQLARSGDKEKEQIAEALHTYIHFGQVISQYGEVNKMIPSNVGIVLGPKFNSMLGLIPFDGSMDPMAAAGKAGLVNTVLEEMTTSVDFSMDFWEKYGAEIYASRQARLEGAIENVHNGEGQYARAMESLRQAQHDIRQTETKLHTLRETYKATKKQKVPKAQKAAKEAMVEKLRAQIKDAEAHFEAMRERANALNEGIDKSHHRLVELAKEGRSLRDSIGRITAAREAYSSAESSSDSSLSSDSSPASPRGSFLPGAAAAAAGSSPDIHREQKAPADDDHSLSDDGDLRRSGPSSGGRR